MRRKRISKRSGAISVRSGAVSVFAVGIVGFLIGNWNGVGLRTTGFTAAQAVALRFPEDWNSDPAGIAASADASATTNAPVMASAQFALFNPQPMAPQAADPQTSVQQASIQQAAVQTATAEDAVALPASRAIPPVQPMPATARAMHETRAAAVATAPRVNNRPGFMLNDAQIASIKERLHLTPDQEQMWPAVEAALRNVAYVQSRDAHRRGAPVSGAQLASADLNSVEVQGLKSAAIPLIMSFNDEQKDEVRNLAHVMGLDQLASQF
jgi:hypothetical protein